MRSYLGFDTGEPAKLQNFIGHYRTCERLAGRGRHKKISMIFASFVNASHDFATFNFDVLAKFLQCGEKDWNVTLCTFLSL